MKQIAILLLLFPVTVGAATPSKSFINGLTNDGVNITCDLPAAQQMKNIGSKLDDAGMCVFTAIEMAARYAGLEQMRGWRDWCAAKYDGGGWPDKVDQCLADWFKEKGLAPIPYLNAQGLDKTKVRELLSLCNKTRRFASFTYGYSPRYGQYIQHMSNVVMFSDKYGVVLDNNFIGENKYEWVQTDELVRRAIVPNKSAWIFVWLHQGPPPSPRNKMVP